MLIRNAGRGCIKRIDDTQHHSCQLSINLKVVESPNNKESVARDDESSIFSPLVLYKYGVWYENIKVIYY